MKIEKILEEGSKSRDPKVMNIWGDILEDLMKELKLVNEELYDKYIECFYLSVYGPHLAKEKIYKWVAHMTNEDGTTGEHWNLDQTTQVGSQYGIKFDKYSAEEWYAVMNMIYSDFYGAVPNDVSVYARMAQKWIEDKDVPEGKLYYYYQKVVKSDA